MRWSWQAFCHAANTVSAACATPYIVSLYIKTRDRYRRFRARRVLGSIIGPVLKILDRMILTELRGPLFSGVAMFSMLTIATVVLQEAARIAIRYNISPQLFLTLVVLAAPQFIVLSIPMGVLLGTLLAVGRLSGDQEITALRACGISLSRVLGPFIVVGIVLSGLTFYGMERLVPYCLSQFEELKTSIRTTGAQGVQRRESWPIYRSGELRWLLVASQVEGELLKSVKLLYFDPTDEYRDFYITADTVIWEGNQWSFLDVRTVFLRPGDQPVVSYNDTAVIPDFSITPESLRLRKKKPEELTTIQLRKLIREAEAEMSAGTSRPAIINVGAEELISGPVASSTSSAPGAAEQPDEEMAGLARQARAKPSSKDILSWRTDLHFKYAMPLTPLFFILVALPIAIRPQRTTGTIGLGLALLIILVYYILYTMCQKLGAVGALPPPVAAWIPNGLLLIVGLTWMRFRERA